MVLSVLYSCGIMAVVFRHSTAFCFEETSTQFLPVKQEIDDDDDDDDDDESIKGNKFCIIEVGQGETLPLHKKVKKLSLLIDAKKKAKQKTRTRLSTRVTKFSWICKAWRTEW